MHAIFAAAVLLNAFGSPTAPITIEVYSDFQCAGCKVLHERTLSPLMKDYVAAGKVYLIHREFPLPNHAWAREAASYAIAAGRVGKYEAAAAALFAKQATLTAAGKVDAAVAGVLTPAEAKRVRALAKAPAIETAIDADMDAGVAAGIRETPTMVITHRLKRQPLAGPVDYRRLREVLDDLLK